MEKTLEMRLEELESENEFLKKYNEKLLMEAEFMDIAPKVQTSFYK